MAPINDRDEAETLRVEGTEAPDHAVHRRYHHHGARNCRDHANRAGDSRHIHADGSGPHDHDHPHDQSHGPLAALKHLVTPHSHDAADKVDSALESSNQGIFALKVSLAALMLTAVVQLAIVWLTGSVALLADTIHNFSDALTAIPLWIAFVLGRRAANRQYTFGYRRAEDLAGLFIVGMIAFSAFLAAFESIHRLLDPEPISNLGVVIAAGVVGFLGNELVAGYRVRVGKRIGSAALVADGLHARTDGFTSLAVVIGAVGVGLGYPAADPIVGLIISVMILFVLKGAATSVFGRLMDSIDPDTVDEVERIARGVRDVQSVDSIRVRWSGHRLEAILHAVIDCDLTVAEGHAIAEEIRHELIHGIRNLDSVTVHVDPCGHRGTDPHETLAHHDRPVALLASAR